VNFPDLVQTVLIYALPVLFAITLHEAAHGYAARYFGDNTAWMMGRVTLNPWPHVDLMGTLAMPLLLYFATSGAFLFGYAKPVPVRFGNLRHPKKDMVWVALAGPGIHLLQALLWGGLWYSLMGPGLWVAGAAGWACLPGRQALMFSRIEPYGFYIVMALVLLGAIHSIWMQPLMGLTFSLLEWVLSPLGFLLK